MYQLKKPVVAAATFLAILTAATVRAQSVAQPDQMVQSAQDGAMHIRSIFTIAAAQMTAEDYAVKPTPEVRSFGELIGHVAETNFFFCSMAIGEKNPGGAIEKTTTSRADLQKALAESLDLCDRAFAAMSDPARANVMRRFQGGDRSSAAVLNFRNYHTLLHWGNVITYMRLRGLVPPSQ